MPLVACPTCGGDPRRHDLRTLARERLSATTTTSGVEAKIERGDFAAAAALDDNCVLGDQLVHQLLRCGDNVAIVTTEDPVGFDLETRIRRVIVLEGAAAGLAWTAAQ